MMQLNNIMAQLMQMRWKQMNLLRKHLFLIYFLISFYSTTVLQKILYVVLPHKLASILASWLEGFKKRRSFAIISSVGLNRSIISTNNQQQLRHYLVALLFTFGEAII